MLNVTKSPVTIADDATVGISAWTNPNNAKVSDNAYATVTDSNGITHYLKATNFGFSIPTGATINGILVEIERIRVRVGPPDTIVDSSIKIVKADGSFGSTNKSASAAWSATEGYVSFGGSSDLWGESWTAENINDADFGVGISALLAVTQGITAKIDHIRITVYYTEASGPANLKSRSGNLSANIKSISGNLIANIKNLSGNS